MTRAAHLLGISWCALAIPLLGASPDPWLRVTSQNFELFTTAGERGGRDLLKHFEQARSFFLQAFGSPRVPGKPARIIVFRSEKDYKLYRPNDYAMAFYQAGADHDFIVMKSAARENYPLAVHEFTHLMIHQVDPKIPIWLNEGLAELYSNLQPTGSQIVVGKVLAGPYQTLSRDQWIDLRTLVAVDHDSPLYNQKSHAGMFYAESWALVHMLNLHAAYRPRIRVMLDALREGDVPAAFDKAYGKSIEAVQADLKAYLEANVINAVAFSIALPKTLDPMRVEGASSFAARLALGELLSNYRGRLTQAREAYEQLARDYPKQWEVEQAWAKFEARQRRNEEALRHFARARELGCPDARLFVEYGRVLGYADRNAEAVAVLKHATSVEPSLEEAHYELGVALVRSGSYEEALAQLRQVHHATPEQAHRYYYNMAYSAYRLHDIAGARALVAKAIPYSRRPEESAALERLSQALDRSGAAQALVAEGALENVECLGKLATLHVRVNGAMREFVIPDPAGITIRNGRGERAELSCGPQTPRTVRIQYQAMPESPGVLIRSLEFP